MDQEPKASTWQPLGADPAEGGGAVWWKYQHISHLWVFGLLKPASTSWDFPGGSDGKASPYNVGDLGWVPGLGRSSGEGNGTPLQYSCLENPMDGGAW